MTTTYLLNATLQDFYRHLSVDDIARFKDQIYNLISKQTICLNPPEPITYGVIKENDTWVCKPEVNNALVSLAGKDVMRLDDKQVDGNVLAASILSLFAVKLNESRR